MPIHSDLQTQSEPLGAVLLSNQSTWRLQQQPKCKAVPRSIQAPPCKAPGEKGTGNCLLHDNTTILDSTTVTANIAHRVDVEPVEVIVPEDDTISDLPDVDNLSEYKEAAISYITGFIVQKIKQKVTFTPCSQVLMVH